jgi:hypothetical protein
VPEFNAGQGVKRQNELAKKKPIRIAIAIVLALLGLLGVISRSTSLSASDLARNEFTQDYVSARAARNGADPYQETFPLVQRYLGSQASAYEHPLFAARNPHPPTQILLVTPMSGLGYKAARLTWLAVMALCFSIAIGLVAKESGLPPAASGVAGIASLAIPVIQKDLLYGQVNAVLLLAIVGAWLALRRSNYPLAGMLVGFAGAVKLFPLFLVVPLFRKSKSSVAWAIATAVVFTIASSAVLGLSSLHRFFADASPSNFRFWRAAPVSISLIGLPFRWLSPNEWNRGAVHLGSIAWAVAIVIILLCVLGAGHTRATSSGDAFWAAAPWMILATPLAWESYLSLTIPFCLLVVMESRRKGRLPTPLMMIALALILIGVPPSLPGSTQGIGLTAELLGYALPTWGLLMAALLDLGRRLSPQREDVYGPKAA